MNPLTENELAELNWAAKNGYISDDLVEELIKNPNAARAYLNTEPVEAE